MANAVLTSLMRAGVSTVIVLMMIALAAAQVMSSTNYAIESDSINVGGGLSTSTNFRLQDTAGEVATGESTSANYELRAGYQQMQEVFISISSASPVTLLPALGGITGGVASGSTAVLVVTDSPSGYQLTIQATGTPAMRSGANSIANYVPVGAVPDFLFITNPTDARFGYSPEGPDIVTRFRDSGSACGVAGSDTAARCWDGVSTTAVTIASKSSSNHPSGATTTIQFRVGLGGNIGVVPGVYVATTTLTALPL